MAELAILFIGLIITGLLALVKFAFALVALTWFWVWVPTFVALLLVFGIWLPDFHH